MTAAKRAELKAANDNYAELKQELEAVKRAGIGHRRGILMGTSTHAVRDGRHGAAARLRLPLWVEGS